LVGRQAMRTFRAGEMLDWGGLSGALHA